MSQLNYYKASNMELRTIIYDDPRATPWDKAYAQAELERRKQQRISGRVDKHAGSRRL